MAISHQRQDFSQGEEVIDILGLFFAGACFCQQILEQLDLLLENLDVRQGTGIVRNVVIVKLDLSQALCRPLMEHIIIVGRIVPARHLGIGFRVEEIVGHEFYNQGHVHMNGPFELGKHGDVIFGALKEGFAFKSFRGNDVMENVHDIFSLAGCLHLHHRVIQQVTAIVFIGRTHVVACPFAKEFHGNQPAISVGHQFSHMGKVRDEFTVDIAVGGMIDCLIKSMGAQSDSAPAEVDLAEIDCVEHIVPGFGSLLNNVVFRDGIIVQCIFGHITLLFNNASNTFVVGMLRIDDKKHIVVRVRHFGERGNQGCFIAVTNVIFISIRFIGSIFLGNKLHVARINVGAMFFFRKPESENATLLQEFRRFFLHLLIGSHPDGTQAELCHLPGIPVGKTVKSGNLRKLIVAVSVPAGIGRTVTLGGQQGGKDLIVL